MDHFLELKSPPQKLNLLDAAISWRMLLKTRCRMPAADGQSSLGERIAHHLPLEKHPLILQALTGFPAMETDRPAWLAARQQCGLQPEAEPFIQGMFWRAMTEAAEMGLYLPEEIMEEIMEVAIEQFLGDNRNGYPGESFLLETGGTAGGKGLA